MIPAGEMLEAARAYEDFLAIEDPTSVDAYRATLIWRQTCGRHWSAQGQEFCAKVPIHVFESNILVPEILAYLNSKVTPHPTIQPERRDK